MAEEEVSIPECVVAIDFGTTYSGYAFQTRQQYDKQPEKMFAPNWVSGTAGMISLKAPTCLLLTPKKEFDKFGYEAEDKFSDLALDDKHGGYYFFRRFKMKLHRNPGLNRDTQIEDEEGKTLPARTVFAHAITYLKKHAMDNMKLQGTELEEWEVRWVLTVPAIWSEAAKQFMREAAQKADITNDQLTIALEPEAASVFCRTIPNAMGNNIIEAGSKYMVVDLGGGTADITVHQVQNDGVLRELHKASGGAWGGTRVDAALEQLFIDIVEEDVWAEFKRKKSGDYFEIFREFEVKKRTVKSEGEQKFYVKFPLSLKEMFEQMRKDKSFNDAVDKNEMYLGRIKVLADKIKIDQQLVKGLFRDPMDKLVEHIRNILSLPNVRGTSTFLLVGGFSESPIVQETVRTAFPKCRAIVPSEAGLSVLKGAVLFGHQPKVIASRICKFTCGIAISKPFIEGHHPPEKRYVSPNGVICRDVFHKYYEAGESVELEEAQSVPFHMARGATMSRVRVYTSTDNDPMFVTDDGCKLLGELIINLGDLDISAGNVSVGLTFGGTEVAVEAREKTSGRTFRTRFDFLGV